MASCSDWPDGRGRLSDVYGDKAGLTPGDVDQVHIMEDAGHAGLWLTYPLIGPPCWLCGIPSALVSLLARWARILSYPLLSTEKRDISCHHFVVALAARGLLGLVIPITLHSF